MNKCFFCGDIVENPELREVVTETKSTVVVNFKVVTRKRVKDGKGGFRVEKSYHDCEAWDSGARIIAENFRQGDKILIEAFARNDRWTDKEGKKCSRTVFRVEHFDLTPFDDQADETQSD